MSQPPIKGATNESFSVPLAVRSNRCETPADAAALICDCSHKPDAASHG